MTPLTRHADYCARLLVKSIPKKLSKSRNLKFLICGREIISGEVA